MTHACAEACSEVISADAGLNKEQSMVLAVSLVGMAQVSARYWLASENPTLAQEQAADLVARPGLARHPRLPRSES